MPSPRFQLDSPFAKFLVSKGHPSIADFGILKNIAARLVRTPGKVAPNSPMLPPLAAYLHVSVKTLQGFCKGEPMSPAFEKKIRGQMERGTIPHGHVVLSRARRVAKLTAQIEADASGDEAATTAEPHVNSNASPFLRLAASKGFTLGKLSEEIPATLAQVWRLSSSDLATNHPLLERVAEIIDVPLADLSAIMKKPPMGDIYVKRAREVLEAARNGHPKPKGKKGKKGQALVVLPAPGNGNGNGSNGHHHAVRASGQYNRLRSARTQLNLRQSARAMVSTLNVTIMKGDTHMPPLPVGDLYLILQDYLFEKGVKATVLIDPDFAQVFDSPK